MYGDSGAVVVCSAGDVGDDGSGDCAVGFRWWSLVVVLVMVVLVVVVVLVREVLNCS